MDDDRLELIKRTAVDIISEEGLKRLAEADRLKSLGADPSRPDLHLAILSSAARASCGVRTRNQSSAILPP